MQAALRRQQTTQARVDQIRSYVASIKEAVDRGPVVDGLDPNGLDPTQAIKDALAATRAGDANRANQLLIGAGAQYDVTGLATWQGAGLPSQSAGTDGHVTVTIDQTEERALLSWNRFDIGANTTLQFNQQENGVAQPDWVAVNRVSNATDPSRILGNLEADGTVVVLNSAGIIFGNNSQVNTHSLLVSTLEIGNAARFVEGNIGPTRASTIAERNAAYLDAGLFLPANGTAGRFADNDGAALLVSGMSTGDGKHFGEVPEGRIVVDSGAEISGGAGGFVMLTAPEIANAGTLSAIDGQVSLQAGRAIIYEESTGADSDADPYVRGYKLNSYAYAQQSSGSIVNSGTINSTRGYVSLGTGANGSIAHSGLIEATTSVSRNGKISLTAGDITLAGSANEALASALVVTADASNETIPVGTPNEPAGFKQSQIEIGTQVSHPAQHVGALVATNLIMGENALVYVPGGDVTVGVSPDTEASLRNNFSVAHPGRIEVGRGALIDVAGLKDVQLPASRNSIEIAPVKRGELRDTPNYREIEVDGNFTLNGKTIFIDPRLSGVREDGVAWVGSPLIEAASLAGQIPATAQEFMTTGGTVTLATSELTDLSNVSVDTAPSVHIARDATIDISGGWVSYAAGTVSTSKLVTANGRIVDIAKASPNEVYVDVITSTTEVRQPRIGMLRNWLVGTGQGQRLDAAYDEGRDAGALTISGAAVTLEGDVDASAFAGARQLAKGSKASLVPDSLARSLQASPYELPSGGALSISSLGDVLVYHGTRGGAEANRAELLLSDTMLNEAGLSQLSLTAAGKVTFAGLDPETLQSPDALTITDVSDFALAPGGILSVEAGRSIRFGGNIEVSSGKIDAHTVLFGKASEPSAAGRLNESISNGSAFRTGLYGEGDGDDLPVDYLLDRDPGALNPFDITVAGTLSTAGLWVNDQRTAGTLKGSAWRNGGSISLKVAPRVFVAIGDSLETATEAVDLSGSIRVNGTLNVMAGGYVAPTGSLLLDGKGGNVSLVNETIYASTNLTDSSAFNPRDFDAQADKPIEGTNQSVEFTPIPSSNPNFFDAILPALVPDPRSTVDIGGSSILGYGFGGGGTFTLVAPDVSFGSDNRAGSTHIGLDFFKTTGFGTLDVSSYRSRIVDDLFANDRASESAFLETTRFVVGHGETFDLTQWMLPTLLRIEQSKALRQLDTGSDLLSQTFLEPTTNEALWDRKAAHLVLGGLTELDVLQGGSITGAPEASLTVSKLYNAGSIVLHGGSITQRNDIVDNLVAGGLGVRDADLGGNGLADAFGGPVDAAGRFLEDAENAAGITDPVDADRLLSNKELVSRDGADRLIYFEGLVGQTEGIVLASGSATDLSGIAVTNPRSLVQVSGASVRAGYVLDGGSLLLAAPTLVGRPVGPSQFANVSTGRTLERADDALLDISGASAVFDQATRLGGFVPYNEWSKAGILSALGGGTLGTTPILARGGAAQAEGGTLEWRDPTIGSADGGSDHLSASVISQSGFDTLIAHGSLTLDGRFDLSLRKALMVTSRDPLQGGLYEQDANLVIGATDGTDATIAASYIRLASRLGRTAIGMTSEQGDARVTLFGGGQGIDIVGGVGFATSIGHLALRSSGDVRLTGTDDRTGGSLPVNNGQLIAGGDLSIDARRTYATTGTGNLQVFLEGGATVPPTPFDIIALGDGGVIFGNSFLDPNGATPLSAGSNLRVLAGRIEQNGYLAAPLGMLELGNSATETIIFGAGSVTSVSGAGLTIPYGTTTDGKEYFFPSVGTPLTKLPAGELVLSADSIVQEEGALIDGRGGGDVYAYEFQSGVGGSRDVLDRYNRDAFSSNLYDPATGVGYQYPDKRQVYALIPLAEAGALAAYDPIYSADYADLYGASAGRTVVLDGGHGIAAGEYLLVPAKYAMAIPGALRVVENPSSAAPLPGTSTQLLDGSVVVGGTYAYADTGIAESTRHPFTVQTKDVFTRYSSIQMTSGSDYLNDLADKNGAGRPRLPLDAARVVLAPLTELELAGAFDLTAGEGGQGGQVDILGSTILIAAADAEADEGVLLISDATLAKLDAPSLLIGGRRSDNADGTTAIIASATNLIVADGAHVEAGELLLAVGGAGSVLSIEDGASLAATGDPAVLTDADYTASGAGSIMRLANGPERLITRDGSGASTLHIGAATLSGEALALDTSGAFLVADDANLDARYAALSGTDIRFVGSDDAVGEAGAIGAGFAAKLAAAERLTVRSPGSIRFASGSYAFNDLVLDTAALAADAGAAAGSAVTIAAGHVRLTNSAGVADGCDGTALCGGASSLTLDATTIALGSGDLSASSFNDTVTLAASDGLYVEGEGSFSAGNAVLALNTPFIAERTVEADPRAQTVRPDYTFLTTDTVSVSAAGANAQAEVTGNTAPGARVAFGTIDDRVASVSISGSTIRATAGIIDIQSEGDVSLAGATLATPGYEKIFGDEVDPVTVSAGGGTINLFSANGSITTDAATSLITDTGKGNAGSLNLLAGSGAVSLLAALNPGLAAIPGEADADGDAQTTDAAADIATALMRQGAFTLDSGAGGFDFSGFVESYGTQFGGDVWVRTGAGSLDLAEGQSLKAKSITLTADGGTITIAGTLDTSGVDVTGMSADAARNAAVNGGDITLWGRQGVTLAATALLDTHTTGYADTDSRPATAGDVTIGIEDPAAALTIASGATIDVGARRTQASPGVGRLISEEIIDTASGSPVTVYRYAEPDMGGTVTFRAPVIGSGHDKVALSQGGSVLGADSVQLEGFQRYDLDAMADSGLYTGITRGEDGAILLDFGAAGSNPLTTDMALADGASSLVRFVQDFDVSTVDGSSLEGMRLRPGIELASAGDVETTSQWNLAAATFSSEQLQAAVEAGVLELIPEISDDDAPRYKVVPGKEGALLEHYATFLYRTDGSARGEAPVVTLRAGGDLTIDRTISDGFFTFRDKSDPDWINYQLGGGDRTYQPAIRFSCGGAFGFCGNIPSYGDGSNPGNSSTLTITLGGATPGTLSSGNAYVNSPLSLSGNDADGGGENGNALGFGDLFPLLHGDVAMHSSDLRLIAGAGAQLSANPLVVDRARAANVVVGGEYSYDLTATGAFGYAGGLQFMLHQSPGSPEVVFDIGETLGLTDTTSGLDQLADDAYTRINWGTGSTGLANDVRVAAQAWFAGKGYTFIGSASNPSGIAAPLNEIVAFLQAFDPTFQAGVASGRSGYVSTTTPPLFNYGNSNRAFVGTTVRTGDGAIAVAAAGDVDLRGGESAVYRRSDGSLATAPNYAGPAANWAAQAASAALYTAGVRMAPSSVQAKIEDTGDIISITPDSPYFAADAERVDFIPSPKALSDDRPALVHRGGDVTIEAGRDVLARRDSWSELFLGEGQAYRIGNTTGDLSTFAPEGIGQATQRWRVGTIGDDTEIGLAARYFTSGVGALGGGDVSIRAGRDVSDLTVSLLSGATTTATDSGRTMLTFGRGDLSLFAGSDILSGRFDIASGTAFIHADGDIGSLGTEPLPLATPQYARIRVADAVVEMSARGSATVGSVSALGVDKGNASAGFFSPEAGFSLSGNEQAAIAQTGAIDGGTDYGRQPAFVSPDTFVASQYVYVMPPTLEMTSISSSVVLPYNAPQLLYPSAIGQLTLLSAGDMDGLVIAMSDADPALLGGAFGAGQFSRDGVNYQIPYVTADTIDAELRRLHSARVTHTGDPEPVRIYSDGDIDTSAIFVPKQARIVAGGDIANMFFNGQNVVTGDITRIRAGGDIVGTIAAAGDKSFVRSSNFILGGPGTFIVEAGGDLGPFVSSADIRGIVDGDDNLYSFAGGIRTVGNDYNPWLPAEGADLSVRFGMAGGADYAALRETYLNPDNLGQLDGDLFEQVTDSFGNVRPNRAKPIYAPKLATWLRDHYPERFAEIFGGERFVSNAALAEAAYGKSAELYTAFSSLDLLHQQDFLINDLYFNEIAAPADAEGPSYLQYVRGYRAVNTLFSPERGYTDNLAPYTTDPSTISEDHPLGEPTRNLVDGQPQRADRVVTGNVDLRLSTIQTVRGGDVTILGPGGDFIAGSVVRTSDQPERRASAFRPPRPDSTPPLESGQLGSPSSGEIDSIPLGYEGLLTLSGGAIRSFTDGDFILNQSRVFTQQSGDITMWSSNGDLAAGQGPKSASNFPPVTVRFDENGFSEVNSAGSVSGAGIGSFQRSP
ncbi:MAG: filamentous hemagglutinin N-terminal domain-containing protein, partial [Tsuneonella suprasediminis]